MKYKNKLSLIFAIVFLVLGIITAILIVINKINFSNIKQTGDLSENVINGVLLWVKELNVPTDLQKDAISDTIKQMNAGDLTVAYMLYKSNLHNQQIFIISMSLLSTLSFLIATYFGIKTILSYKASKKFQLTAV